jgi:hypothetical protein
VEISHNTKVGALLAAACVAAGAGTAFAVWKLNSPPASAATKPGGLRTGVIGRPDGFGFAPPGGFGFDRRGPGFGFGRGGGLSAAAGYLGLSTSQLVTKLQSGQTLAQIAEATSGKSVAGLVAAMTAAQKTELDNAVKGGRLTQAQADSLAAALKDRVTAMVNGRFGFRFGGPPRSDDDGPPGTAL